MDKFQSIKFWNKLDKFHVFKIWNKQIGIFNRLNTNVVFHDAIKKKASDCTVVPQILMNIHNRKDYLKPLIEKHYKDKPVDFLEFGTYSGTSIFGVADHNTHPESRFYGFDTFEGNPESFHNHPKGIKSTYGNIPTTKDKRITFVKGLFQDTLDDFLQTFVPKSRLLIHMDADTYSATLFVLTKLDKLFDKDTIISLDEFGYLDKEFLAFHDYTRA